MKAKEYADLYRSKCASAETLEKRVSVLIDMLYAMHGEAIGLAKKRGVKTDAGLFPCLKEVVQKLDSMMSQLEAEYKLSELRQTPKELYLSLLEKLYPDIFVHIRGRL